MEDMIKKAASVAELAVTDKELALINQLTLKELTADEVFTFKVAICDNQVDRDFEKFSDDCLDGLAKLYNGRTIIADHKSSSSNQCARIYSTEVVTNGDTKQLIAHCYAVRTDSNKDFITEIEAGIKKEVSVGCKVGKAICSICKTDNKKSYCEHYAGHTYGEQKCYFTLDEAVDAYEVSFVAVPAQPNAGVTKSYGVDKPTEKPTEQPNNQAESIVDFEMKSIDAFLFVNKNMEEI